MSTLRLKFNVPPISLKFLEFLVCFIIRFGWPVIRFLLLQGISGLVNESVELDLLLLHNWVEVVVYYDVLVTYLPYILSFWPPSIIWLESIEESSSLRFGSPRWVFTACNGHFLRLFYLFSSYFVCVRGKHRLSYHLIISFIFVKILIYVLKLVARVLKEIQSINLLIMCISILKNTTFRVRRDVYILFL